MAPSSATTLGTSDVLYRRSPERTMNISRPISKSQHWLGLITNNILDDHITWTLTIAFLHHAYRYITGLRLVLLGAGRYQSSRGANPTCFRPIRFRRQYFNSNYWSISLLTCSTCARIFFHSCFNSTADDGD